MHGQKMQAMDSVMQLLHTNHKPNTCITFTLLFYHKKGQENTGCQYPSQNYCLKSQS
jgi:hypothetical protein